MTEERALWAAVIERAIKDAVGEFESGWMKAKTRERLIRTARAWFEKADHGFEAICDAANLHPDSVRRYAMNKFNNPPELAPKQRAA